MVVFVVEDDDIQLQVFSSILPKNGEMESVRLFSSAEAALAEMEKTGPDILITDLVLPVMSGAELIYKALEKSPGLKVIAISGTADQASILDAIKAGAVGFLQKPFPPEDILKAIRDVKGGGSPINPRLSRLVIEEFQKTGKRVDFQPSDNEKEILEMIARGSSYKEVAEAKKMSVQSIYWHMRNIMRKLYASNKKDAVEKAKRLGLIN